MSAYELAQLNVGVIRAPMDSPVMDDLAANLDRIKCPVRLVTGDEDPVAPASNARTMAERLSDARVTILNRCGHWSTIERPQDCNQVLKELLGGRA